MRGDIHVHDRPHSTWMNQICQDTGVTATEALELAEDERLCRTIAMAGGYKQR